MSTQEGEREQPIYKVSCKLAGELGIPEQGDQVSIMQFLHHYAGVLMYFPELEELKDTVICDTQVVYDSATNLIVNTFKFGLVGMAASERFRETGQFSLEDIRGATENVSGDYIPLQKLVKLLEHLNIIVPITPFNSIIPSSPSPPPGHLSSEEFRGDILHALRPSECHT